MTVRVSAAPSVLSWALQISSTDPEALRNRFAVDKWIEGSTLPHAEAAGAVRDRYGDPVRLLPAGRAPSVEVARP